VLDLTEGQKPRWHEIETLLSPPARAGHTLTWIGGNRIILFGGRGIHYEVLNDVWMFNMKGSCPEWVELCAHEPDPPNGIPEPRSGHSSTPMFGGKVLIDGGEDTHRCRKDDVWILDPTAGNFVDTPAPCSSSPDIRVPENMPKQKNQLIICGRNSSRRESHQNGDLFMEHVLLIVGVPYLFLGGWLIVNFNKLWLLD
jgi:hypothetical protein